MADAAPSRNYIGDNRQIIAMLRLCLAAPGLPVYRNPVKPQVVKRYFSSRTSKPEPPVWINQSGPMYFRLDRAGNDSAVSGAISITFTST
jgi:hypothetical protein